MKYIVIGKIKHDGKSLKVGSTVEFDGDEGDRLVKGGFLAVAGSEEAREATPAKKGGK